MPKTKLKFALSHEEREHDYSGTPYGLMVHSERLDDVSFHEALTPEQEQNVLVDYPVSAVCAKHSGYARFVRWRKPVKGCRYGAAKFQSTVAAA